MPGQDVRDWDFAKRFSLSIVRTVQPPKDWQGDAYLGEGPAIASANAEVSLNGLNIADAKRTISATLNSLANSTCPSASLFNQRARRWIRTKWNVPSRTMASW